MSGEQDKKPNKNISDYKWDFPVSCFSISRGICHCPWKQGCQWFAWKVNDIVPHDRGLDPGNVIILDFQMFILESHVFKSAPNSFIHVDFDSYTLYTHIDAKSEPLCGPVPFSKVQWISHCCFVMVITKEEVRNNTKPRTTNLVLSAALGSISLVDGHLSSGPVLSTAACDCHICVQTLTAAKAILPQSSCYTQFIKMITQATAGKLGALKST